MNRTMETSSFTQIQFGALWKRVFAGLLDLLILNLIGFAIGLLFSYNPIAEASEMIQLAMKNPGGTPPSPSIPPAILTFTLLVLNWLYKAGLESSPLRGTLGKSMLGLMVADLNGQRIDFGQATYRYALTLLSGVMALVPALAMTSFGLLVANALLIPFSKNRQAAHDLIAKTIVIDR